MGTYYNDGYYKGQVDSDNEPHGYGDFEFNNGNIYKGEWRHGKMHGYGKYILSDGTKYTGDFRDGKFNGEGTIKYASGDSYSGDWVDDKPHGHGTLRYDNGDTYSGDFRYGRFNGSGVMRLTNGSYYDGEWKDGKRHGHGTFHKANGDIISGEWYYNDFVSNSSTSYTEGESYTPKKQYNPPVKKKPEATTAEKEALRRYRANLAQKRAKKRKIITPLCILGMISAVALDFILVDKFKNASGLWQWLLLPIISIALLGGMTLILSKVNENRYISGDVALAWIWRITGIVWGLLRGGNIVGAYFTVLSGWKIILAILTFLFVFAFNIIGPCIMIFTDWDE